MPTPRLTTAWASAAFVLARAGGGASRLLRRGNGKTLPGRIALRLVPDALERLSRGRSVVVVSGTNGKTTTTRLLAHALAAEGTVTSNEDGANLRSGLVSTLLSARGRTTLTVLEVDEVVLPAVLVATSPRVVVLLNLSRDQLDRTSEVGDHVAAWGAALWDVPAARVVANADDALVVAAVLAARPDAHLVTWVGVGKAFREDSALCPRCAGLWDGHVQEWICHRCGLARPAAALQLDGDRLLRPSGAAVPLDLQLPGAANVANAVAAAAAAGELGIGIEQAVQRMRTVAEVQGRYSRIVVGDRSLRLLLAKNPAGWRESLDQLEGSSAPVLVAVNARAADGTDPSWLWDVPFERLAGRVVIACGERAHDVSVRLRYAGVPHRVALDYASAVAMLPPGEGHVVANYTAFVKVLAEAS